jgi:diguanylate cyclase (GGDEF)-like protein
MSLSPDKKPNASTPVVLCVSEDTAFLNTVRVNLGQAGFVVVTSRNPQEALDLSVSQEMDAFICDYAMSQLDGISLFERLKSARADRTPPTLIVNDKYAAPLLARCVTAGAAGLHAKVEPPETLVERVISMVADVEKRRHLETTASRRAVQGGTDPLTRIASKEHFARRLSAESIASYRDANHLSVAVLSVDRYDRIQERHGVQRAENMLSQAARLIEGELRSRDCVGRYSDHAFGIVLPETPLEAASSVASRLRRTLAALELGDLDHPIAITVSAGVASRPAGVRLSPDELMTQALKNCAASQSMGGDRVVADSAITGKPIALVLCPGECDASARLTKGLEDRGLEVRKAASLDEARRIMTDIPAALVAAIRAKGGEDAGDLLIWARGRFPSARRVLVTPTTDPELVVRAVNEAAIDYILLAPWPEDRISKLVDTLIYS